MSLIVETKIMGAYDLDLLIEALQAMGLNASRIETDEKIKGKKIAGAFVYKRNRMGIYMNKNQEFIIVDDSDLDVINEEVFMDKLIRQYGVASVKKKAKQLQYTVIEEEVLENNSIRVAVQTWGKRMNKKEIIFEVDLKGNIRSEIKGTKGKTCTKILAELEKGIGQYFDERESY